MIPIPPDTLRIASKITDQTVQKIVPFVMVIYQLLKPFILIGWLEQNGFYIGQDFLAVG